MRHSFLRKKASMWKAWYREQMRSVSGQAWQGFYQDQANIAEREEGHWGQTVRHLQDALLNHSRGRAESAEMKGNFAETQRKNAETQRAERKKYEGHQGVTDELGARGLSINNAREVITWRAATNARKSSFQRDMSERSEEEKFKWYEDVIKEEEEKLGELKQFDKECTRKAQSHLQAGRMDFVNEYHEWVETKTDIELRARTAMIAHLKLTQMAFLAANFESEKRFLDQFIDKRIELEKLAELREKFLKEIQEREREAWEQEQKVPQQRSDSLSRRGEALLNRQRLAEEREHQQKEKWKQEQEAFERKIQEEQAQLLRQRELEEEARQLRQRQQEEEARQLRQRQQEEEARQLRQRQQEEEARQLRQRQQEEEARQLRQRQQEEEARQLRQRQQEEEQAQALRAQQPQFAPTLQASQLDEFSSLLQEGNEAPQSLRARESLSERSLRATRFRQLRIQELQGGQARALPVLKNRSRETFDRIMLGIESPEVGGNTSALVHLDNAQFYEGRASLDIDYLKNCWSDVFRKLQDDELHTFLFVHSLHYRNLVKSNLEVHMSQQNINAMVQEMRNRVQNKRALREKVRPMRSLNSRLALAYGPSLGQLEGGFPQVNDLIAFLNERLKERNLPLGLFDQCQSHLDIHVTCGVISSTYEKIYVLGKGDVTVDAILQAVADMDRKQRGGAIASGMYHPALTEEDLKWRLQIYNQERESLKNLGRESLETTALSTEVGAMSQLFKSPVTQDQRIINAFTKILIKPLAIGKGEHPEGVFYLKQKAERRKVTGSR